MPMILKKPLYSLSMIVIATFVVSCAGSSVYRPPGETTQAGADYSDTDIQIMANQMYNKLQTRVHEFLPADAPTPVIALLRITNKTSEHIDMEMISDKLQIALIKAGSFRFVDRGVIQDAAREWDLGGSGMIDAETAKAAGRVLGADFLLYGTMSSIKKTSGREHLNYYRLSMRLTDVETNEIVWADESEIKKRSEESWITW